MASNEVESPEGSREFFENSIVASKLPATKDCFGRAEIQNDWKEVRVAAHHDLY